MLRLLWPLLYMGMLYFLSSIPGTPIPENGSGFLTLAWLPATAQNFLHFPAYGLLAWLWYRGLVRLSSTRTGARAQAFFLTLGYGLFDEWHQSWVPGRLSSATDLGVDALGALVVLMLTPVLEESLPTRLKS